MNGFITKFEFLSRGKDTKGTHRICPNIVVSGAKHDSFKSIEVERCQNLDHGNANWRISVTTPWPNSTVSKLSNAPVRDQQTSSTQVLAQCYMAHARSLLGAAVFMVLQSFVKLPSNVDRVVGFEASDQASYYANLISMGLYGCCLVVLAIGVWCIVQTYKAYDLMDLQKLESDLPDASKQKWLWRGATTALVFATIAVFIFLDRLNKSDILPFAVNEVVFQAFYLALVVGLVLAAFCRIGQAMVILQEKQVM
jgi:hypothetical protein